MAYIFSAFSDVSISSKTRNTLLKSSELSHTIKETPSNSQTRKPNINVRTVRNVTTTGTTVMTSIKSVYGIFATVRINAFFNVFLIGFSYHACNANP